MRIGYINADYGVPVLGGKGSSVHVKEMVNAFNRLGHDVCLLHTRLGHGSRAPDAELVTVAAGGGELGDSAHLPAEKRDRHRKELGWIAAAEAIEARLLAEHRAAPFDLLYERYSLWSCAGPRAGRALGIPCVLEVNAPLVQEAQEFRDIADIGFAREVEAEAFKKATSVVAVSKMVEDYVVAKGIERDRVSVIENGVDADAFNPSVAPAVVEGLGAGPVIGFVGGLKNWHGIQNLLHGFRHVLESVPDAKLLIVGDGPKRGWIHGFVEGAGMEEQVHLTGWVEHGSLPPLVARMDVAVAPYPASEDFYFSPLKLFEYMAAGKPVVASRLGQICDVIEHEQSGLLVEPGDPRQLAFGIVRLIKSADLRRAIGSAARETAMKRSWLANAKQVLQLEAAAMTNAA